MDALFILAARPGNIFTERFSRHGRAVQIKQAVLFGDWAQSGNVMLSFATLVLPVIIFVGALMTVLFHLGIMQWVMRGLGFVLRKTIGINGVEALAASMNIFVGQDSAPFAVRPYLATMPKSTFIS